MGLPPTPKIDGIVGPQAPTPARARAMDTYPAEVATAFAAKAAAFFNGATHTDDDIINMISSAGYFKVVSYPNQGNPNDIHYVVFFYNKVSQQTIEVLGTIAIFYIQRVRNVADIMDFPISDSRLAMANTQDGISYFSQYSLRWEQATNNVIPKFYKPYDPAQVQAAARLHDYDPVRKETLVAYSEEYAVATKAISFSNWKDKKGLDRYNGSIGVRSVGMPTQILLHETAGFGNLSISGVPESKTAKGNTFFAIPHFCVNNMDGRGNGSIIQFVDIASNTPHGESANQRSVGIEFVNAPIEAYSKTDGRPVFHLEERVDGIYVATKLTGDLSKIFIPLELSPEQKEGYYELAISKKSLLNYKPLKAGIGADKKQVVFDYDDAVLIKYAKSDKFEHLAYLVANLVSNKLIGGFVDLSQEQFWYPVFANSGSPVYMFDHCWVPTGKDNLDKLFFVDIRKPGILTHLFVGGHVDGGVPGLYLYLRFVKLVPVWAILQLILTFLTSERTAAEKAGVTLKSQLLIKLDGSVVVPPKQTELKVANVVELQADQISAAASP